ncbi:MAG TPA: hypothetical protein VI199_07535 [Novosphingobium sp.]
MSTDPTTALILAYVDDALDPEARRAFEGRLAAEPELAKRVAQQRWLARQIVAAFGPPPSDALPPALLAALGAPEPPAMPRLRGAMATRRPAWRRLAVRIAVPAAMAASLAMGLWLGGAAPGGRGLTAWQDGQLVAVNDLAGALTRQDSGQPGPVTIGMTIRTAQGACRTFSTTGGTSGLACRQGERWTLPVVVSGPGQAPAAGEYRLAAGAVAPAVMAEVDRRSAGAPLSADEERAWRRRDWRGR